MAEEKALAGKVAIITGSGKNIGKAIAHRLAADGAAIVVNGRGDRPIVEGTAKEIRDAGGRAMPYLADVSKPDQVAAMVEIAVKEFGGVDIAVGNAGLRRQTSFLQMSLEEWHEILSVALDGAFTLAKAVVPEMIKRGGGSFVGLSGVSHHAGSTGRVHVNASKAGLEGFLRGLAMELAPPRRARSTRCAAPPPAGPTAAVSPATSRSAVRAGPRKSPRWCAFWSVPKAATSPARRSTSTAACSSGNRWGRRAAD
jgi:3-oxoacyl-[acyl-carrier protein] reductase